MGYKPPTLVRGELTSESTVNNVNLHVDKTKSTNFAKLVDDIQKIQKQIDTTTNTYSS